MYDFDRQFVGLGFGRTRVRASVAAASPEICSTHLYRVIHGAQGGTVLFRVGQSIGLERQSIGSTISDVIVRAGCSRLQLIALHWATSVALLQVVDN